MSFQNYRLTGIIFRKFSAVAAFACQLNRPIARTRGADDLPQPLSPWLVNQGSAPRHHDDIARDLRAMDRGIPNRQIASHRDFEGLQRMTTAAVGLSSKRLANHITGELRRSANDNDDRLADSTSSNAGYAGDATGKDRSSTAESAPPAK
jgi:hypothetical protein